MDDRRMTLQEALTAEAGWISSEDRLHHELFQPGPGTAIRVALHADGAVRVSEFDCQMSWKWTADFSADVDDAMIAGFLFLALAANGG